MFVRYHLCTLRQNQNHCQQCSHRINRPEILRDNQLMSHRDNLPFSQRPSLFVSLLCNRHVNHLCSHRQRLFRNLRFNQYLHQQCIPHHSRLIHHLFNHSQNHRRDLVGSQLPSPSRIPLVFLAQHLLGKYIIPYDIKCHIILHVILYTSSRQPSAQPTENPSSQPSSVPTKQPFSYPSGSYIVHLVHIIDVNIT